MIRLVISAFYYYSLKIGIIFKAFKSKGEILKRSVKYLIFFMAAFFICAPIQQALASSEVYIGMNTYSPSVKRWAVSIDSAPFNSVSWIWNLDLKDKLHKNGRRDTILVVPETAIPEDITLVVWFHGLNGFSEKTFAKRIIPQMDYLVDGGNSFAIAIPEMPWSTNTSTTRKRQGRVWTKPGELERYIEDLKEHLEAWALLKHGKSLDNIRIMFVGHSAGGSAIKAAAIEGGLCRVSPEAVIWSDASYGRWLDTAWSGCVESLSSDTEAHILVRKWDTPHKNAERAMKVIRRAKHQNTGPNVLYQVLDRKALTHGKIGNNVFLLTDVFPPGC